MTSGLDPLVQRSRAWLAGHRGAVEAAPGVVGSLALHGLGAVIILLMLLNRAQHGPEPLPHWVPVDLVALGETTTAPPAPDHALTPQEKAMRGPQSAPKFEGVRPNGARPPPDSLEARLKTFAQLRQPDSDLKIANGASDVTATSDGAEGPAAYGMRDYIRAQVLRRWDFNLAQLGKRRMTIALHIVLNGHGAVRRVEIADLSRHKKDTAWRNIAIAARNAVLLSAPFKLPPSLEGKGLDLTLTLNPHDTLR
jgi:hypothetical protein